MPNERQADKVKGRRANIGGVDKKRPGSVPSFITPKPKPAAPVNEFPTAPFPVSVFKARSAPGVVVKKWCFENNVRVSRTDESPDRIYTLKQGSVVTVRQQSVRVPGDDNTWAEIEYTHTEFSKLEKRWVTSTVTGWVNEIYLDDYNQKYPTDVVKIEHPTEDPGDAQQYMTWDRNLADATDTGIRYNMCGELCVAYIVTKEIDPNTSIESVLEKWKNAPKEKKGSFSYSLSTIKAGTGVAHLQDILQLYPQYASPTPDQIMKLRDGLGLVEGMPFKWDGLKEKLKTHYLIVLTNIDKSGTLISKHKPGIAHWVLVENITRNGKAVELYNPFPNRLQEYSLSEFVASCSTGPISGLWVKRKTTVAAGSLRSVVKPQFQVHLGIIRPPDYQGAEQYIDREGGKKTNLCGEFSVAYIVNKSIDRNLMQWRARRSVELAEYLKILKPYGFFEHKTSEPKPFTIGTVLDHWRDVQPELYRHHVVDNQPTGQRELATILDAYGYKKPGTSGPNDPGDYVGFRSGLTDPITRKYLPSPGRMAKMLKTHFLIAGVGIHNTTGQLKSPGGVRHWVVVEKIIPAGKHYLTSHFGGSGGWVELYNPFTNVLEEYSYLEFTNSMSETGLWDGLWVKRDVDPLFRPQAALFPVIDEPKGRGNPAKASNFKRAAVSTKWKIEKLREIIAKRIKNGRKPQEILDFLSKAGTGWSVQEMANLIPNLEKPVSAPTDDLKALETEICTEMKVNSIPLAVTEWINNLSKGDRTLAFELASAFRRYGILTFDNNKQGQFKMVDPAAFESPNKVVREIGAAFAQKAMEEISAIQDRLAKEDKVADVAPANNTLLNAAVNLVAEQELEIYRVRAYGDPIMVEQAGASIHLKTVDSNFGVIPLYCPEDETWSAVAKYVKLNRSDIEKLLKMQVKGRNDPFDPKQKMNWLIFPGNFVRPMWTGDETLDWKTAPEVRAGVMVYAGQLVAVDGEAEFFTSLRGDNGPKEKVKMRRIVCFRRADWGKTHETHPHLVVKATAVRGDNVYDEDPRGTIYSPVMFDPRDFPFGGGKQVKAFYIPEAWLMDRNTDPKTYLKEPKNNP